VLLGPRHRPEAVIIQFMSSGIRKLISFFLTFLPFMYIECFMGEGSTSIMNLQ